MNILSIKKLSILTAIVLAFVLVSCKKESSNNSTATPDPVTEEQAVTYTQESTEAESGFDDVEDLAMIAGGEEQVTSAAKEGEGARLFPFVSLRLRIGACATITVTPNDSTYPKTVTIDFGAGCPGRDGKVRKGAIILHFTGPIRKAGSVLTITLRDYYVGRVHIEGTKIISNLSENGNIKYTVQVVDGKLTLPNDRGYTYNSLRYVAQIEGGATTDVMDDIFRIEGRSETKFNNGTTITFNTDSALIKKTICPWISKGVLKVKINSRVFSLDYGAPSNGDCDNKALLTWDNGNKQRLISLP